MYLSIGKGPELSIFFKGKVTRDKRTRSIYRDMEQNKGKGNDTLENSVVKLFTK